MVLPSYRWEKRIATYEAGPDETLRLSALLRLQQEVGELHLGQGGLDFRAFAEKGMGFVLIRTNCVIHRLPRIGETILLDTWHRNAKGVQFFRCYTFLDAQGIPLIESVSAFALVDVQTHKLLRSTVFDQFGLENNASHFNGCPDPAKWTLPPTTEAGIFPVRWSSIDWNGHMNNTVYADLLCDFVPGGLGGKAITGFSIAFLKEALEGDVLHIEHALTNGEAWVIGAHEQEKCFEARLTFSE